MRSTRRALSLATPHGTSATAPADQARTSEGWSEHEYAMGWRMACPCVKHRRYSLLNNKVCEFSRRRSQKINVVKIQKKGCSISSSLSHLGGAGVGGAAGAGCEVRCGACNRVYLASCNNMNMTSAASLNLWQLHLEYEPTHCPPSVQNSRAASSRRWLRSGNNLEVRSLGQYRRFCPIYSHNDP